MVFFIITGLILAIFLIYLAFHDGYRSGYTDGYMQSIQDDNIWPDNVRRMDK